MTIYSWAYIWAGCSSPYKLLPIIHNGVGHDVHPEVHKVNFFAQLMTRGCWPISQKEGAMSASLEYVDNVAHLARRDESYLVIIMILQRVLGGVLILLEALDSPTAIASRQRFSFRKL